MLLDTNAVISTTSGSQSNLGNPVLTCVEVMIGPPSPEDQQAVVGGIVRHVVLFDPGTDIAAGDKLYIQEWGEHTVNPRRSFHVFPPKEAGGLGLEAIKALIGDKIDR